MQLMEVPELLWKRWEGLIPLVLMTMKILGDFRYELHFHTLADIQHYSNDKSKLIYWTIDLRVTLVLLSLS